MGQVLLPILLNYEKLITPPPLVPSVLFISEHDFLVVAAPPQVAMCSCKLRCACRTYFGGTCDVRACGAFLGMQSAIAISQYYFKHIKKLDLIFFSEHQKFVNLQYNTLVPWDKQLTIEVSDVPSIILFFIISCKILHKSLFIFFYFVIQIKSFECPKSQIMKKKIML